MPGTILVGDCREQLATLPDGCALTHGAFPAILLVRQEAGVPSCQPTTGIMTATVRPRSGCSCFLAETGHLQTGAVCCSGGVGYGP